MSHKITHGPLERYDILLPCIPARWDYFHFNFVVLLLQILEIADICCHGRVVSVLEGGYGRTPYRPSDSEEPLPLDKTLFAECAVRHLQAMVDPYDAEVRFPGR